MTCKKVKILLYPHFVYEIIAYQRHQNKRINRKYLTYTTADWHIYVGVMPLLMMRVT
jgi:hypothetical protein